MHARDRAEPRIGTLANGKCRPASFPPESRYTQQQYCSWHTPAWMQLAGPPGIVETRVSIPAAGPDAARDSHAQEASSSGLETTRRCFPLPGIPRIAVSSSKAGPFSTFGFSFYNVSISLPGLYEVVCPRCYAISISLSFGDLSGDC